jgi:hypothetical protein
MKSASKDDDEPVLSHVIYANQLRIHAVTLIHMGHQRLEGSCFAQAHEDAITGELVRAMKLVAEDPVSPTWVDYYEINEQVRQNVADQTGKSRPIMDLQIECHRRGPRPRLGFEAKRLGRGRGEGDYLGKEGMAAFLSGYYPTTHGDAGMIGYVQERSLNEWSQRLAENVEQNGMQYRVAEGGTWKVMGGDPAWACTRHTDLETLPMFVIHVLLQCY